MTQGPNEDPFAALRLFEAVKLLTRCFNDASLEELLATHDMVHNHFIEVVDASRGSFQNAAEQRVLGNLWAEIEMAIDERRSREG